MVRYLRKEVDNNGKYDTIIPINVMTELSAKRKSCKREGIVKALDLPPRMPLPNGS